MSLHVYIVKSDIPENIPFIEDNEEYFFEHTRPKLDSHVDTILDGIDSGKYFDKNTWIDRFGKARMWRELSTGGKTALNIYYNPDVAFSLIECGMNVHNVISTFDRGRPVGLYLHRNDGIDTCDVIDTDNEHFNSIKQYSEVWYDWNKKI